MANFIKDSLELNKKLLETVNTKEEFMIVANDIFNLEHGLNSCLHENTQYIFIDSFKCFCCMNCANILFIKEAE